MSIRLLDCATLHPLIPRWHVATPALLVDTDEGPVLVDTGLGVHDHTAPSLMVRLFSADLGVRRDPSRAAVNQLAQYGVAPEDVRHIVLTHLHFDHAGGLPDFPHAKIHIHRVERDAMVQRRGWSALGYDRSDFAHGPQWVCYETPTNQWFGLDAIRLPFEPEMLLIPLHGHTLGHCGVAIHDPAAASDEGWVFQAADALPTNAEFDLTPDWLNRLAIGPHVPRLRALAAAHPEVTVLAGHIWSSTLAAFESEGRLRTGNR